MRSLHSSVARRSGSALVCCLPLVVSLACDAPRSPEPKLEPCSSILASAPQVTWRSAGGAIATVCQEGGSGQASLVDSADLKVEGFAPIGPAMSLHLDRAVPLRGVEVTLPILEERIKELPGRLADPAQVFGKFRPQIVVLARFGNAPAHVAAVSNLAISYAEHGQLRFRLPPHEITPHGKKGELAPVATFQVALPERLATASKKRRTYRVIGGVSMGGIGSSMTFFRNPDLFDAIGVMGADPGPDLVYTQGFIRDFFFGGFCTADDQQKGRGPIGTLCETLRSPLSGQGEISGSFEKLPIQKGEGIGLTLSRALYLKANRDLVRALGNWAYHNPSDPTEYLPPGVPASTLSETPQQACDKPVVLKGRSSGGQAPFFDGRYNPEGLFDVITFCDAEADGNQGIFDGAKQGRNPAQILLAVDLNSNGKRDSGEPIILQSGEPYRDVGLDGIDSKSEPGYDPDKNPDPAGDDYHYLKNPQGTEGNWRYDKGEPFQDTGLNGVSCKPGLPTSCMDLGEGNGSYDVNPGLARWLAHDPRTLLENMKDPQLSRLDFYYDAGIRDFFNAHVSTNSLFGALSARGRSLRTFDTFPAILGLPPSADSQFDGRKVDLSHLSQTTYVRYGNPFGSEMDAMASGDGRHVGTAQQVLNRAILLFWWMLNRWPDADRTSSDGDDPRLNPKGLMIAQKSGRNTPYSIVLPPGYYDPENQNLRYPVAYFMHGLGQKPEDLAMIGSIMFLFMADPEPSRRLPKAILVFLDGKCRPGGEITGGPLPQMGDRCETGAFYTDHKDGEYRGQEMFRELDAHIGATYRVRQPEEVDAD